MAKQLSPEQQQGLLNALQTRFEKNMARHKGIGWNDVQARLQANPAKLWSLDAMEETEGEPDLVGVDEKTGEYIFMDCSPERPPQPVL